MKTTLNTLIEKWEKDLMTIHSLRFESNSKEHFEAQSRYDAVKEFLSDLRAALPEEEKRKKRLFEVLDEMNIEDGINKTSLVAVSPNFISADKVKGGTKVSMGAEDYVINDLLTDKSMPILLIIDKKEYFKRSNL